MFDYYLTFRSVTGAQHGARLLERAGVSCLMGRTPKSISANGCGYVLRVRESDIRHAAAILRESGAPYQRIYQTGPGGALEEMLL